jgi:hypothetical protein
MTQTHAHATARFRPSTWIGAGLVAIALALGLGAWFFGDELTAPDIDPKTVAERQQELHELAARLVKERKLARGDGYVKTVDAAQMLWYFALAKDNDLYTLLRDRLVDKVVVNDPNQKISRHFVAWRYWPGEEDKPLDASGTTEALRLAKALWIGAIQFDRPGDRDLALNIIRGYARHQATFSGIWLIRNYYNLRENHFATNSYTIDYDPDLVAAAADYTDSEKLQKVADRSAKKIDQAIASTGLIRQIIQPELKTLMPDKDAIFSPNNVEQLSNSAETATCAHHTAPQAGQGVLDFSLNRGSYLRQLYNASSGEPITTDGAGAETFAPLVRLAIQQDRPKAMRIMLKRLMDTARPWSIEQTPLKSRAYNLSQALVTLQRVQRYRAEDQSIVTVHQALDN